MSFPFREELLTRMALNVEWQMLHASSNHRKPLLAPLSKSPRWQLVMIEVVEESIDHLSIDYERCLLCLPRVGDALNRNHSTSPLVLVSTCVASLVRRGWYSL